ncbi:MAG: diguanylate cyclase, partial [Burkholderiales bacterium]|nr:diguanylate cyclase [Burkholderiales bacterium]
NGAGRALAITFNNMASEVQRLLASLQQSQRELASEKEKVETTLASIGDAVISTDVNGRILTLNKVAQQLTGWGRKEASATPLNHIFGLVDDDSRSALTEFLQNICNSDSVLQSSNQLLLTRFGKQLEIDYSAAPIRQNDGGVTGCVLVFRDVSEKRNLQRQISWQAGHDVLTGLENRASLTERFKHAIAHAQTRHQWLAVCLLDLDHFQAINEKYGSDMSDKLLQQVARRLEDSIGQDNHVARLGGDEFAVLLQNQTDTAGVELNLSLLLAALAQPYEIEKRSIIMTASIGVAIYPRDDVNADTLLRCADQAMYQAKLSGRNQFHLFDAQHNQRARIREALHKGEFCLYFQPKVNMRAGTVVGLEALLRWQHPEDGLIGPLHFFTAGRTHRSDYRHRRLGVASGHAAIA